MSAPGSAKPDECQVTDAYGPCEEPRARHHEDDIRHQYDDGSPPAPEPKMTRAKGKRIARELAPALHRVFQYVLAGGETEEIAKALGRSRSTIRNQVIAILRTFGVTSRLELLAIFVLRQ